MDCKDFIMIAVVKEMDELEEAVQNLFTVKEAIDIVKKLHDIVEALVCAYEDKCSKRRCAKCDQEYLCAVRQAIMTISHEIFRKYKSNFEELDRRTGERYRDVLDLLKQNNI